MVVVCAVMARRQVPTLRRHSRYTPETGRQPVKASVR
jgi:hypothetical protein